MPTDILDETVIDYLFVALPEPRSDVPRSGPVPDAGQPLHATERLLRATPRWMW